jgi:predicted Zn-dependent protease
MGKILTDERMGNMRVWFCIILIGFVHTGLTGCASDKSTIQKASLANDQLAPAVIHDQQLADYLQTLGNRVIAAARVYDSNGQGPKSHKKGDASWMFTSRMQFHLVNSKTVNAFTTGGEHMYVYTALFQLCDNEDELAAVMSHEFAHVYCRHVQQGTNRQTGMKVFAYGAEGAGYLYGGADDAATASKGASAIAQFAGLSFTRGDEAEADKWGFQFYSRAGWDPHHFADFFQKMINLGYDVTPAYKSDHPTLKSRVDAADKELPAWEKQNGDTFLRPTIADASTFAQLKARAASISASSPDDSGTKAAQKLLASFSSCVAPVDQPEQAEAKKELLVPDGK